MVSSNLFNPIPLDFNFASNVGKIGAFTLNFLTSSTVRGIPVLGNATKSHHWATSFSSFWIVQSSEGCSKIRPLKSKLSLKPTLLEVHHSAVSPTRQMLTEDDEENKCYNEAKNRNEPLNTAEVGEISYVRRILEEKTLNWLKTSDFFVNDEVEEIWLCLKTKSEWRSVGSLFLKISWKCLLRVGESGYKTLQECI